MRAGALATTRSHGYQSAMTGNRGVVAAGHPATAEAAADVLREGGNAFDAAIAALFTACAAEPVFASLGGGGALMAFEAKRRRARAFDFFAHTPRIKRSEDELHFHAVDADFGPATQEFHIGAGSAAVPGIVQGAWAVHEALGTIPMRRLLEPAIDAAGNGVTVSGLHAYLHTVIAPILTASDGARALFASSGALPEAGETWRNPDLAGLLDALGAEGPRLVTEGEVARAIVAQSENLGGHLTMEDLKAYAVEQREPLAWHYRDRAISLNPPPAASGALIAFGLGLLQRIPETDPPSAMTLARVMEQTNDVRAARGQELHAILGDAVLTEHFAAMEKHQPATRGTTHISVIDRQGNAAAVTITNGEGNGLVVDGCGFMLNNMLGEEDLNPRGFHQWTPGTRLSTMMAPTVMLGEDGGVTALGSGGSNRIRTAILQVIVNLAARNMDIESAVRAARLHVERDGAVSIEDGHWTETFSDAEREDLAAAFPDMQRWPEANLFFGGVHAARRGGRGGFEGAGDPRRGGICVIV